VIPPRSTLDELHSVVSYTIHKAAVAQAKGDVDLARFEHLVVSMTEERIANLLPADHSEGAIARRGVVTAAIAAEQYTRGVQMANTYLQDPNVTSTLRTQLTELRDAASKR
jgi:hypothetical protein